MLTEEDQRTREVVNKLLQLPIDASDEVVEKTIEGSQINFSAAIAIISGIAGEVRFSDNSVLKLNRFSS